MRARPVNATPDRNSRQQSATMNEEKVTIPIGRPWRSAINDSTVQTRRMPAGAQAPSYRPLDIPSDSGSLALGEQRIRLESGLVLWARIMALIVFSIAVFSAILNLALSGSVAEVRLTWAEPLLFSYLAGISVALSRLRLDLRGLEIADIVSTVGSGLAFALMVSNAPSIPEDARELVFEITLAHVLMIRAGVVPSSGQRSLWVGALTVAPGLWMCTLGRATSDVPALAAIAQMAIRCTATIVASALASRRIYGLQRQVTKALKLGQYTLQERVGSGGMGVVFKASHALLRRPTAIKLLRPDEAGPSTLTQFEREAQLTSLLTHPSTIQIYDFGRNESGVFYYAMEYLEGLTLHDLIELTGPQSAPRTIALLVQVCGSLAEAHAVGLVHRDIKPANIMVCERGRVADVIKVLDFGLVKTRGQAPNTLDGRVGSIAGTPGFMSPEAIVAPESVDARSDIYALGAVAYYLITGQHLFPDGNDVAVLLDQVNTPPVPMSVRLGAHVPTDLDELITSCLSKDPAQRPQTAEELCDRLLACADAPRWSQAHARAWWAAHRELVEHRVGERAASIQGSFAARLRADGPRDRATS
jgi:eukaryotic-like serine/threonine-protein kinase